MHFNPILTHHMCIFVNTKSFINKRAIIGKKQLNYVVEHAKNNLYFVLRLVRMGKVS